MKWYWIALILGAGVAPWVTNGRAIMLGFLRSPLEGVGVWLGGAYVTTPIIFLIMWLGTLVGL